MNLQQLEYFKTICEIKNFTAASTVLSVTQPALSKAISKLEEELDVTLFEREGRNIKITKSGEIFLKYAENALNEIQRGKEVLEDMKKKDEMTISLGSTYCISATFIPFLISDFLNNNLKAKFNFITESSEVIFKDLRSGKIELGFFDDIDNIESYDEIETQLIKEEEYVLIVPKNHHLSNKEEVSLKDLEDEYFISCSTKGYGKKIPYSEFIEYTPKISVEPNEAGMLAGLVAAGAGIAISLNTPLVNTNKISVIKIKDTIGNKRIYMGWNKNLNISKNTQEFKEYVLGLYN
ncbi:LysR family transcriptional regulator [Clostridium sp. SM-530-WT-3G]|uniref:LysR family transcriptional regulator n=1 Tax=Clostridium sp. SM-530-WT-3G TaxID=2725303 RepID=UPI00145E5918|nr:LysR family transcriptional regulator [Clostridium sp. SM-530-WT-3G]NME84218.1 LysR family transcriptional regulator [Clostridium sp. SM-530-WT-3G]